MPGKYPVLLAFLLLCSLYHSGNNGSPAYELYKKADKLFKLENPTDQTDSIALATFKQVIQLLEKKPADSLLFQCWLKTGVLLDVQTRYNDALDAYLIAIALRKKENTAPDSTLFLPYVYAGTAYYHLNNFDSADYYLLQAELIGNHFKRVPEKDRLYNALGALYYENGNYMQSRNYFTRALEIIREDNPGDQESAIHFEGNIAASNYRLGLYDESLKQYEKLLSMKMYTSQVNINMGKAYMLKNNYAEALKCFRRVDRKALPGVINEMAQAHEMLGNIDSAVFYLDTFKDGYDKKLPHYTQLDMGINHFYRSGVLRSHVNDIEALQFLQKAIIIFSGSFTNEDIDSNPADFTGSFASYKLFDALFKKASALEVLYRREKKNEYLLPAYNAYQSATSLLRYIEKSYDTDDAKLLLKQRSQSAYTHAFLLCMELAEANPKANYLEQAFLITEKNKASVVASKLIESKQKKMRGIDPALLQQERNIKYNIARLNIKTETAQDKILSDSLTKERQHLEIDLSRLQKKIEQNSSYYKLKYADSFPSISELQKKIISKHQAVISLYALMDNLHLFVITSAGLQYLKVDSLHYLQAKTNSYVKQLGSSEEGRRFNGSALGDALALQLVVPISKMAGSSNEWIILPDGIFHYLPFESLPNGNGFLLESKTISYHFSTRFLIQEENKRKKKYDILSMAPFAASELPNSAGEIAGLPGQQYADSKATKEIFLQQLNRYPVVHLATHAIADTGNSARSYIAFYPSHNVPAENNLYLDELYGLNLDSTDLVIVSACETGTGQLIGSEGIMSLSRGFTYAGCNSVVNSLWKADDAATAAILKQFHVYLKKGYSKSKALQKAKLDYLKSDAVNKSPDYWAHLILIGDAKPLVKKKSSAIWISILGPAAVMSMTAIYIVSKKRRKKAIS